MVPSSESELMYCLVCSLLSDPSLHDTMALRRRRGDDGCGDQEQSESEKRASEQSGEGVMVGAFDC